VVTDVFIYRVKLCKKSLLANLEHEDEGCMIFRNVGNYLPNYTAFHLRRSESILWAYHLKSSY